MLNDAQVAHVDTIDHLDKSAIEASGSKTSSKGIILIPQPSDNPNDPLVGALGIWIRVVPLLTRYPTELVDDEEIVVPCYYMRNSICRDSTRISQLIGLLSSGCTIRKDTSGNII
jgi:hypothetical protein